MKRAALQIVLIAFHSLALFSQKRAIDSIGRVISGSKNDTTVARAYLVLTKLIFAEHPDTLIPTCKKVIAIADHHLLKCNKQEKHSYLMSKAAAFSNIGIVYYQRGETDTSLAYLLKGLEVQEELGEKQEIANSLNSIGGVYLNAGKADLALNYFQKALIAAREAGSVEISAFVLGNIGSVYDNFGQTKLALEYYFESLKKQEEQKNKAGIGSCLNNIAAIFMKQGDMDEALDYFTKSMNAREKTGDTRGVAQSLNNIGTLYLKTHLEEKAIDCFLKSKSIYESINHMAGVAYSLSNMASAFKAMGKTQKALDLYAQGLKLHEEADDKKGLATCLTNMATCHLTDKHPERAMPLAKRALEVAEESRNAEGMRDAYSVLSDISKTMGNSDAALDYFRKHVELRDSVNNNETRKLAIKKQLHYDYEKKAEADKLMQEKRDALKEEELKAQKKWKWAASAFIAVFFLTALLLVNSLRLKQKNVLQNELNIQQKKQADAIMETQEQERKRIAEDLHDGLGHLLSTVKLNLQTAVPGPQQVKNSLQLLNQASEEMRNIIFNLMPRTLEEDGLIPALRELSAKITAAGVVKIALHVHGMEKFELEKQSQFNIYRIIQEAVNNILKHANAKEITIQLIGQPDHITIMVEDDGKGFDPVSKKEGRGLKNIVTRSLWLKGNVNIDSGPGRGTTITTEFPV